MKKKPQSKARGGRGGGGGGGRGGRGGRGGQQRVPAVTRLGMLNPVLLNRILVYLVPQDKQVMGKALPRFGQLFVRQQKMMEQQRQQRQKQREHLQKLAKQKKREGVPLDELAALQQKDNDIGSLTVVNTEEENKEDDAETEGDQADGDDSSNQAGDDQQNVDYSESATQAKANAQKALVKKAEDAKREQNSMNADAHTLLARLNSRRLYQRLRHFSRGPIAMPVVDMYLLNRTTEQMAAQEWQTVCTEFQKTQGDKELAKRMALIPSMYELLLFSPCPRAVAVLASYPRSGNSLMRNLYERTTLRITGSDMRGGLAKHDLVGEAAVQTNMVQFVKTHYPERLGSPAFPANRAVLLVRNPYDAIESYYNLMVTNTHTTSISEEQRQKYQKDWDAMVLKEVQVWKQFHEYWLSQDIPLLVVRYEDLIRDTDKVMTKVLQFVLEVKNMGFFQDRIDKCIRQEQIEKLGSYKPRSGGIGKSLKKYSPEVLQEMNVGMYNIMTKFGYDEMLVPSPDDWKLEPLDEYGVEIEATSTNVKPLMINGGKAVRTQALNTNWQRVRNNMKGVTNAKCNCARCRGGR
jgi:hypothetical protein